MSVEWNHVAVVMIQTDADVNALALEGAGVVADHGSLRLALRL